MKVLSFKFKPSSKTNARSKETVIGGITTGIVLLVDGEYRVEADYVEGTKVNVPFTPNSYNLKDRLYVFERKKGEHGYVCVVRDADRAKMNPGDPERYVPFAPGWTVKGHLVKKDGKMYFRFKNIVTINGLIRRSHYGEE